MKRLYYAMLMCPLLLTGCQGEGMQSTGKEPVQVKVFQVSATSVDGTGHFSGTVEEKSGTALSFSSAGTLSTMNVRLGDRVHRGQTIATLDETSARSSHEAAQATLLQAEDAYRRMKTLHKKGSLADIKWVEVQSQLQQARSAEAVARKLLSDCRLVAPFDGVISDKSGEVGQTVLPGAAVARLVSTVGQQVRIAVPEGEIGDIAVGQKARIAVPALDGKVFQGTVTERGVTADAFSRSYEVKLRVDDADASLLPGMVAEVSLTGKEGHTAYVLPPHIVQLDETNCTFVWVASEGHAEKRRVVCGDYTADGVIVDEGLKEGDQVIVEGQQKVCEGTKISL